MKDFTNEMCVSRNLTVAKKGKHFDGSEIEHGETIAWSKDKYHLLTNDKKKSFVVDCAIAVMDVKENCCSKDDFIRGMEERGWHTTWTENRKNITFENDNGEKVRDSNISKSFSMDISKEVLNGEFERQNEIRRAKLKSKRDRAAERERNKQLDKYYTEVESAIQGNGVAGETVRSIEASDRTEGQTVGTGETRRSGTDTDAFIEDIRSEINDNRSKNRVVANTENKSISDAEQRRIEEEQRTFAEEKAARAARKTHEHSSFSR
jgi:recombination DNA repair RAD52 pathway protein